MAGLYTGSDITLTATHVCMLGVSGGLTVTAVRTGYCPPHCASLRGYLRDHPAPWGHLSSEEGLSDSPLKVTVLSVFVDTFLSQSLSLPLISSSLHLFLSPVSLFPCPAPAFCPYPQNEPDKKAAFGAPYQETTWTTGLHSRSPSGLP